MLSCPAAKPDPRAALQREVLVAFDREVARPALEQFTLDAAGLQRAVTAWSSADVAGEPAALVTAKAAFETAFLSWQRLEVMQVGPLGSATRVTLGQGLRDEVYTWPVANLCRVDTSLVTGPEPTDESLDAALVTEKGFLVLEHLLWSTAATNECPPSATINTDGSWAALAMTPTLAQRRKVHAAAVARHLERTAARLRDAWSAEGAFGDRLGKAGETGSAWRSPADALDDVFNGLFYVDLVVKDEKLARPAGLLTMGCATPVCPERAEAQRAKLSTKALVVNLTMARTILTGSADPSSAVKGFDDLLDDRGAGTLKDELLGTLDAATTGAKQLPAPIDELATNQLAVLQAEHAAVKAFTDLLRTQFVTTLSLTVPQEGAGDND